MPMAFSAEENAAIRETLLREARRCAVTLGLRKTSVEQLTEAAGISKGLFYKYFASKELLFFEVLEDIHSEVYQVAEQALEEGKDLPPDERIANVLLTACSRLSEIGAMKFIEDNKDKAFFGYFTYTIPHAELCQPQDSIVDMYKGKFQEPHPWYDNGDYGTATNPRAQFAAMITRLDTYVGQIIDKLEELGISEKTLFIFTSDNGPHNEGGADPTFFNTEERLRGLKRALYEGGMRVPYIAYWPGTIEAGSISDLMAAGWDMMPTFVELLGEDTNWREEAMDGLSILPTLTGKGEQRQHDFLYWEFHEENGRQAVRAGDWKLIRQNIKNGNPTHELYNIAEDPHEDNNLANTYPDKVEELKVIMDREHIHSDIFNFGR